MSEEDNFARARLESIRRSKYDAKTAYHTLRKCSIPGWEYPDERITEAEMENLYLLLTEKIIKATPDKQK